MQDNRVPGWEKSQPKKQLDFLRSVVDTVRQPMLVLDSSLRVVLASRAFCRTFGVSPEETKGALVPGRAHHAL